MTEACAESRGPLNVVVTVAESRHALTPEERRRRAAAALAEIAARGGISGIDDPVEWQREIRRDRPLPGREEMTRTWLGRGPRRHDLVAVMHWRRDERDWQVRVK